jgi:hypothetical protein
MKLNFIRHGFAAGCEAGLRPAVNNIKGGAGMGLARTRGIAQNQNKPTYGEAEPRLTSGGEAGVDEVKFQDSS